MDKKRKQEIREFAGGWAVVNMVPRVSDITRELLDALDAADARATELETQLVPLLQQFDDWAEQNRRAEDRAARLRAALEAAAESAWQSEVIEPQMSDLLIGDGNEYANKRDWLDSKVAEWMETQP